MLVITTIITAGAIVRIDSSNNNVKSKAPGHFVAGPNPSKVVIEHSAESAAIETIITNPAKEKKKS